MPKSDCHIATFPKWQSGWSNFDHPDRQAATFPKWRSGWSRNDHPGRQGATFKSGALGYPAGQGRQGATLSSGALAGVALLIGHRFGRMRAMKRRLWAAALVIGLAGCFDDQLDRSGTSYRGQPVELPAVSEASVATAARVDQIG